MSVSIAGAGSGARERACEEAGSGDGDGTVTMDAGLDGGWLSSGPEPSGDSLLPLPLAAAWLAAARLTETSDDVRARAPS